MGGHHRCDATIHTDATIHGRTTSRCQRGIQGGRTRGTDATAEEAVHTVVVGDAGDAIREANAAGADTNADADAAEGEVLEIAEGRSGAVDGGRTRGAAPA